MKKKQIIFLSIFVAILVIASIGIIIYCTIKGSKVDNNYTGGVKSVDFSNYENKELSSVQTITSGGVYTLKGDYDGTITVKANNADVKLILDNANITAKDGPAIYIDSADVVYIELVGNNKIEATTTEELDSAIYSKSDLCLTGDGELSIKSNYDGIAGKDDLEIEKGTYIITSSDDGIVGRDSLYILDGSFDITSSGDGLKTTNEEEKGIMTILKGTFKIESKGDAIDSVGNLTIEGGEYTITTGNGSNSSYSNSNVSLKAIKSAKDIKILNGTFNINSQDDAIHSNANVELSGGKFEIASGDDGIHADKNTIINDGTINITKSYEGIEGLNITVNGGDIKVNASDDGFNAAGGDGSSQGRPGSPNYSNNKETSVLTITGGSIYVNSSGDGLDSNGNIIITGGTTYVDGPTNNGNGAMDYGDGGSYKFEITGGELIAVGSKGMAVAPNGDTSVTSVLINTDNAYNGTITLGDITYIPAKAYNSILICSNKLSQGNTYTLKINNTDIQSVTLNNKVTTSGTTGNMGGPGGGDHGGGARRGW